MPRGTCLANPAPMDYFKRKSMYRYKNIKIDGKTCGEHRLVVEKFIGRKLLPDEIVHHKDNDGRNNDISNLEIMSRSEHAKLHYIPPTTHERRLNATKKLNWSWGKTLEVLAELKNGKTQQKVAEMFGIARSTVWLIKEKKHWTFDKEFQ